MPLINKTTLEARLRQKTKVLQITGYPPPRAGWGIRVEYLKKEMEKNGDICTVLNVGKSRFLTDRDFIPVFNGLDYIKKVFKFRFKGFKIHMHLNGDSPKGFILSVLAISISLLTLHRPIVTMHAGPVQFYFPRSKAPLLIPIFKYIFGTAKFIICNHDSVKQNIVGYGVDPKKIFSIPAFSKQYMNFERVKLDNKLESLFNKGFPIIGTYCALRPLFFIEDALTAFHQLRQKYENAILIIMGENTPENPEYSIYSQKLIKMIDDLQLNDAVHFAGDLDHDAFLTLLSKITLFLRTPIKDGVSSSVLESLALRIPVVAVENPLRPEQVILYKLNDIDDMVEKMSLVIDNHEQFMKNIKLPEIEDTVSKEIEVIKQA